MKPAASRADRHNKWFTEPEVRAVIRMRAEGLTYNEIGFRLGRSFSSVKGFVGRNLTAPKIEWPLP